MKKMPLMFRSERNKVFWDFLSKYETEENEKEKSIWLSEEWKENKVRFIKERDAKCEICGSKEYLTVALNPLEKHTSIKRLVLNVIIRHPEWRKFLDKDCCPECKQTSIYERKETVHKYRCQICGFEFDNPSIITKYLSAKDNNTVVKEFLEINGEQLIDYYKKLKEEERNKYLSLEGARLLCRSCHYKTHRNMEFCQKVFSVK